MPAIASPPTPRTVRAYVAQRQPATAAQASDLVATEVAYESIDWTPTDAQLPGASPGAATTADLPGVQHDAGHQGPGAIASSPHLTSRTARDVSVLSIPPAVQAALQKGDSIVTSYRDHLAIQQRVDGLDQLVLRTYAGEERRIPFEEASYSTAFLGNPEFAPEAYRLAYSSMVTPATIYDYHPEEDRLEVRKVQEIPSGYDASRYATERLHGDPRGYVIIPNVQRIRQAVDDAFSISPQVQDQRDALAQEGASIWVLNGTTKQGQASDIAAYLEYYGLNASAPVQKPDVKPAKTSIVVYHGSETSLQSTDAN